MIARTGREKRALLCEKLGLDPQSPLYLLYLGQDGYEGMKWENLTAIQGAQYFTFKPIAGSEGIVHVIPKGLMEHADATASADAVIGKLGYSLCAECLATGTPLIFPPRPDFVEAVALGRGMLESGLGVPVQAEEFRSLRWAGAISRARELGRQAKPIDCSGAQICAEIIAMAWREGNLRSVLGE
ncbi:hypothetical protein HYR69_08975 [Candidatus Sumerlaeota bacterium]|nr:hypothetical protein [Candidatus Sumerlaeota bacterium]MBI3735924.1 hypothetical protein [Candidatus Sumerlaeota bacterium]